MLPRAPIPAGVEYFQGRGIHKFFRRQLPPMPHQPRSPFYRRSQCPGRPTGGGGCFSGPGAGGSSRARPPWPRGGFEAPRPRLWRVPAPPTPGRLLLPPSSRPGGQGCAGAAARSARGRCVFALPTEASSSSFSSSPSSARGSSPRCRRCPAGL